MVGTERTLVDGATRRYDVALDIIVEDSMNFSKQTNSHVYQVPRGGALDANWPRIPVAHLSFETDNHFSTIHCLNA